MKEKFKNLFNLNVPLARKDFWCMFWIFPVFALLCIFIFFGLFTALHWSMTTFIVVPNAISCFFTLFFMLLIIRRGLDVGIARWALYSWAVWVVIDSSLGAFGLIFWINLVGNAVIGCLPSHYVKKNAIEEAQDEEKL
ncbi:hypothetical protein [Catellicoccus marimammalium]|uniref:Uncharacterized protein n=1 Tax=Catellicoccus marimammalium M35/04/3 TaxID=1234409 RepID=K8ZQF3_9ENTE|nr:hypothetical protein [Catellicoccus marimammalium]EKU27806.1 hypothetical protein C683_0271 [Catellicoccus marimammalium M35/04/3]